jgi:hypothetical protein
LPLVKVTDTLVHQADASADAAMGLYYYGKTTVFGVGGDSDCPSGSGVTCPYFERMSISASGNLSIDSWAYYPVQKKWVSLLSPYTQFFVEQGDLNHDGAAWTSSATLQAPTMVSGQWQYKIGTGDVAYRLYISASSIVGTAVSTAAGSVTYPADAKTFTVSLEQQSGIFVSLKKGGLWSNSDDGTKYDTVAALRSAHTTISTPLCLASSSLPSKMLVYFDAGTHSAAIAKDTSLCPKSFSTATARGLTTVESGVKTLSGRPIIVTQLPDAAFDIGSSARKKQALAVVGLNAAGIASNGTAYLPGYTNTFTKYSNKSAFITWLNTVTTDPQAQNLP